MNNARVFIALLICLTLVIPGAHARTGFGKEVIVKAGTSVDEAVCIGENVRVYGRVKEDAVSIGGDVIIEPGGIVEEDASSIGGNVIVKDGAIIKGNATSLGGDVTVYSGGSIEGETYDQSNIPVARIFRGFPGIGVFPNIARTIFIGPFFGLFGAAGFAFGMIFLMLKLAVSIAFAAIVTYLFPRHVSRMAVYLQSDFPKALLLGIVLTVLIPVTALMLVITIIGLPLVPVLIAIIIVGYIFGATGLSLWVGRIIPESEGRTMMVNVLLGVLAIGIVKQLPIIGAIVGIFMWSAALGVVILTRFGSETAGPAA